ncbi:nocturnin-like isoform X2 [Portunus trituberculatus]|uniref:nocturnin-like isoform X2 n=1 Tax=Portunus trituberculatus TaxID=210409 RepID=UPI001E1CC055|nr:nocturnin-like isoform X2 [Portunus trituberculatus]
MTAIGRIEGMGSFTSKPQVEKVECAEDKVGVPDGVAAGRALLQWVREPIAHLPPLLPRLYRTPPPFPVTPSKAPLPPPSSPSSFRIMQWNILAQALGTHADNFAQCPREALEWDTRKYRILEEVLTHLPHVLCLQEVDHFGYLEKVLARQGYRGVFMPKPDSPCLYLPNNNGPDGCAIFWDDNKFELVKKESRVVEVWHVQSNQVAILLVLEERSSGRRVLVLTTHLKARQGALLASLRNEQGKDLLSFLDTHRNDEPTVVCGDFNAEPSEPVYSTMTDTSTRLQSSYAFLNGGAEPDYSTWKVRGDVDCCHNIDYIFYTPSSLQVTGGVDVPTEEALGPGRAPCLAYPSDHFSLICDLTFSDTDAHPHTHAKPESSR